MEVQVLLMLLAELSLMSSAMVGLQLVLLSVISLSKTDGPIRSPAFCYRIYSADGESVGMIIHQPVLI